MTDSTAALISSNPEQGTEASFHEAKNQVLIALPFVVTNLSFHLTCLISIMFVGHLGELELDRATLANAWATITGFVVMVGLSGALETLCGHGFEARDYRMLGIHLQAPCIVSLPFTIFIAILWFHTEPILKF